MLALLLAAGCDDDGGRGDGELPPLMTLSGGAAVTLQDGRSAVCSLDLHIELTDDGTQDGAWRVYRATSGGDATRTVTADDGSGFSFWPHLYSEATVRVSADSIEVEADGLDETTERFYREIMLLRGAREDGGAIATGDWLCQPLDIDNGGYVDTAVVAPGSWILEASTNSPID